MGKTNNGEQMNRREFIKNVLLALPAAYLLPAVSDVPVTHYVVKTEIGNIWVPPEVIAKEALDILNKEWAEQII